MPLGQQGADPDAPLEDCLLDMLVDLLGSGQLFSNLCIHLVSIVSKYRNRRSSNSVASNAVDITCEPASAAHCRPHPDRAEKYAYCTADECQRVNARGLAMVAVGE